MDNQSVETINKDYYNQLYRKKNSFFQLIHPFISFDQQSKSKFNYTLIKGLFKQARKNKNLLNFLDYGFGHGSFMLKIPQKKALFGCDISIEAVTHFPHVAQKFKKQVITFVPENMSSTLGGTKLDIISLSHIIEHVEDDAALLKELAQHMSPEGKFLINVPINEVWVDPKHVRTYDKAYMQDLMDKCGFKIDKLQEVDRWTAFLLTAEMVKKAGKFKKLYLRAIRLFLAILPLGMVNFFEFLLSKKYQHQQLIVLASQK